MLSRPAGGYRPGQRPLQPVAHDRFGLSIAWGMIAERRRRTATVLERPGAEWREDVRRAEVARIDQASWREDRARAWPGVALTPLVTASTIAATRCGGVARRILGAVARRAVLSDRSPSSGGIEVRQWR